jgi:hypothetical protein
MSGFDRPRSMADMVVEQATAAPGEVRDTPARRSGVCPTCGQTTPVSSSSTVVDL